MSLFTAEAAADTAAIDYGPLAGLMGDPAVTEIMVNGHREIWIERAGHLLLTDAVFDSEAQLMSLIWEIAVYVGRHVNRDEPMLDARLPDGSRVNAILPPVSLSGPVMTIRRFSAENAGEKRVSSERGRGRSTRKSAFTRPGRGESTTIRSAR